MGIEKITKARRARKGDAMTETGRRGKFIFGMGMLRALCLGSTIQVVEGWRSVTKYFVVVLHSLFFFFFFGWDPGGFKGYRRDCCNSRWHEGNEKQHYYIGRPGQELLSYRWRGAHGATMARK
jgi:hypothetical protein